MRVALARNWWSLLVRGLAGITLGVITFVWPRITLTALVFLFAAYAFIEGVMSIVGAVRAAERGERWGALVFEGLVGLAAGVVAVVWPSITVLALLFVIAAWAIITGILEVATAIRLRQYISGEWLLALAGIASVIFGVLILFMPMAGALVLALWIGAYAFVFGVMEVILGIRLREFRGNLFGGPSVPAPAH